MPFDSEGMFSRLHNWEDDRINDIDIVTDHHDEEDDNFGVPDENKAKQLNTGNIFLILMILVLLPLIFIHKLLITMVRS